MNDDEQDDIQRIDGVFNTDQYLVRLVGSVNCEPDAYEEVRRRLGEMDYNIRSIETRTDSNTGEEFYHIKVSERL